MQIAPVAWISIKYMDHLNKFAENKQIMELE